MMWKIRRAKDRFAMHWRIRRIVLQSEIFSLLGDIRDWRHPSYTNKPRIRIISVSGRNIVRIR